MPVVQDYPTYRLVAGMVDRLKDAVTRLDGSAVNAAIEEFRSAGLPRVADAVWRLIDADGLAEYARRVKAGELVAQAAGSTVEERK